MCCYLSRHDSHGEGQGRTGIRGSKSWPPLSVTDSFIQWDCPPKSTSTKSRNHPVMVALAFHDQAVSFLQGVGMCRNGCRAGSHSNINKKARDTSTSQEPEAHIQDRRILAAPLQSRSEHMQSWLHGGSWNKRQVGSLGMK